MAKNPHINIHHITTKDQIQHYTMPLHLITSYQTIISRLIILNIHRINEKTLPIQSQTVS